MLSLTHYLTMKNITRVCNQIDNDTPKIFIHVLVLSSLDHRNSLLLGSAQYQIKKIQRIQHMTAHIILRTARFDHITVVLMDVPLA